MEKTYPAETIPLLRAAASGRGIVGFQALVDALRQRDGDDGRLLKEIILPSFGNYGGCHGGAEVAHKKEEAHGPSSAPG